MLDQRVYSDDEIDKIIHYAHEQDNLQAATEARHHMKYFGKTVRVVKGRKVPIGATGYVFWLSRKHFSNNAWTGFETRIGIRTDDGEVFFISSGNVEVVNT